MIEAKCELLQSHIKIELCFIFHLQEILTQLRTIFDLVIEFQAAQDNFYSEATQELDIRRCYGHRRERRSKEVIYHI